MTASPAGIAPGSWLAVLRLAFAARPWLAIRALAVRALGKKVRAWNWLCFAAAENPDYYRAWIKAVEPRLLPRAAPIESGLVGAVLLDGDSAETRASLRSAFGPGIQIFDATAPPGGAKVPQWLLPICAGDRVSPALGAVLGQRLPHCNAPLVYWDEDGVVLGRRTAPWIKPDWDPLLFRANGGLVGSCVLRSGGSIDAPRGDWFALALHRAEGAAAPLHLPMILTHRSAPHAARTRPTVAAPSVSISVLVPTRDRAELLATCLEGLSRTQFPGEHEIIIVDNGSCEPSTRALFERLEATGEARVLPQPGPFSFAALANAGVAAARGEFVCLLNNDIEVLSPTWLERMAAWASREDVGAVGARLLYPDGTIQHAGVALGIAGSAGHVEKGATPIPGAFAPWHGETRTVSAVTAACLLVSRTKYCAVGGMDAQNFAIDFNDVDLCLKLAARGWQSLYCAEATLVHHESRSRGRVRRGPDKVRFESEIAMLRARWGTETVVDRHHSPLFDLKSERCLLAF